MQICCNNCLCFVLVSTYFLSIMPCLVCYHFCIANYLNKLFDFCNSNKNTVFTYKRLKSQNNGRYVRSENEVIFCLIVQNFEYLS